MSGNCRELTGLFLLGRGATSLENLEVNETEGHEAKGEARHYSGEEHQHAGDPCVHEPPHRTEGYVIALQGTVVVIMMWRRQPGQVLGKYPGHSDRVNQVHGQRNQKTVINRWSNSVPAEDRR